MTFEPCLIKARKQSRVVVIPGNQEDIKTLRYRSAGRSAAHDTPPVPCMRLISVVLWSFNGRPASIFGDWHVTDADYQSRSFSADAEHR